MIQTRPFSFTDLLIFLNKNTRSYCLENPVRFTSGRSLPGKYFSGFFSLLPSSMIAVSLLENQEYGWAGDLYFDTGALTAWIDQLLEMPGADSASLQSMLDYFTTQAGDKKMTFIAAAVDENAWFCSAFRQCGFSVCFRQTIYHTLYHKPSHSSLRDWKLIDRNQFGIFDSLSRSQIPPTAHNIRRRWDERKTWSLSVNGEAIAFIGAEQAAGKLYLEPVFHPETQDPASILFSLAEQLGMEEGKSIFVNVPSYQSWIGYKLPSADWENVCNQIIFTKALTSKIEEKSFLRSFEKNTNFVPELQQQVKNISRRE